ncbi:AAA family ATPase [Photobacterium leiognathi]|uniref:AAA family ATPase n=1 Tax=Photobacterium leiognathi TaxID=553611 RepID=UPI0027374419|nr:AAA family ATPase [Photobacterium leiognathi]
MAKAAKRAYVCSDCGMDFARWQGQCSGCKSWNTITEFTIPNTKSGLTSSAARASVGGYAGVVGGGSKKLNEVEAVEAEKMLTGIGEPDRVLCGGLTTGSVNIISGDPGAGKTTLLSDLVARMSKLMPSLYCTAEESLSPV